MVLLIVQHFVLCEVTEDSYFRHSELDSESLEVLVRRTMSQRDSPKRKCRDEAKPSNRVQDDNRKERHSEPLYGVKNP